MRITYKMNQFGEYVREVRENKRVSTSQLAGALGVTPGYVNNIELGVFLPSDTKLNVIARRLRLDPTILNDLKERSRPIYSFSA